MKKEYVVGAAAGIIVLITVMVWLLNAQFNVQTQIADLQTKNNQLIAKNSDLQRQINELQNQTDSLESQNTQLVKNLGDLTEQLASERPLQIEIVSLSHDNTWFPWAGLTVAYAFNVTVRNNDVVVVSGLNLTVETYLDNERNGQTWMLSSETALLNPREEHLFSGYVLVGIDTPSRLTYVATIKSGETVLDQFTHS